MADYSRFPLPTDTAHVRIESRQYRIFSVDLGEGIARWKAGVAAVLVAPYWLALTAVFHLSPLAGHGRGGLLFLFPPVVAVWAALRPDAGGRPRYALWLDRGRFRVRRSRPMIEGPLAATAPGRPFLVCAQWVVLDPARTRRLSRHTAPDRPRPVQRPSSAALPAKNKGLSR